MKSSDVNFRWVMPSRDGRFSASRTSPRRFRHSRSSAIGAHPFTPDRWLENGDQVMIGNLVLQVRHCPGHTPGHVVFISEQARVAAVGDVIFQGSIGPSDLPAAITTS